jgi:hypothetical protein
MKYAIFSHKNESTPYFRACYPCREIAELRFSMWAANDRKSSTADVPVWTYIVSVPDDVRPEEWFGSDGFLANQTVRLEEK